MTTNHEQTESNHDLPGALKNWVMVALTFIFILLYASALIGWIKPLADEKMIVRLEPIIFVIIGYYFGRLPSQQNENTLKGEISRQTQKADHAQRSKEQAQQAREALEEKVKNARAALTSSASSASIRADAYSVADSRERADLPVKDEALRQSVLATLSVLDS